MPLHCLHHAASCAVWQASALHPGAHAAFLRMSREAREAAEREHEREKDAARERARLLRADTEEPDSDEDEPRWRRKPLATRCFVVLEHPSGSMRECCVDRLKPAPMMTRSGCKPLTM